jgi:hypothetical protein
VDNGFAGAVKRCRSEASFVDVHGRFNSMRYKGMAEKVLPETRGSTEG